MVKIAGEGLNLDRPPEIITNGVLLTPDVSDKPIGSGSTNR
jgi:hypothetical protein